MYILTRTDLDPGLQAAQTAHAAFQFACEHSDVTAKWHRDSSYLIVLGVPDEETLTDYARLVEQAGVPCSLFREPDIGDEATALAVAPSELWRMFSDLPLLGKELVAV